MDERKAKILLMLWCALAFVMISPITAFYPCVWRGYYIGWGIVLFILLQFLFDWRSETKKHKEV